MKKPIKVAKKIKPEYSLFLMILIIPTKKELTPKIPVIIIGIVNLRLLKNVSHPLSQRLTNKKNNPRKIKKK